MSMYIIITIVSFVLVMLISLIVAYKKIVKDKSISPIKPHYENDVNLDDVCSSGYLKLTNVHPVIGVKSTD